MSECRLHCLGLPSYLSYCFENADTEVVFLLGNDLFAGCHLVFELLLWSQLSFKRTPSPLLLPSQVFVVHSASIVSTFFQSP